MDNGSYVDDVWQSFWHVLTVIWGS